MCFKDRFEKSPWLDFSSLNKTATKDSDMAPNNSAARYAYPDMILFEGDLQVRLPVFHVVGRISARSMAFL